LSRESKRRIRDEEESISEETSILRKYKRILKYIQGVLTQPRSNMEEKMRAVEMQESLQDILMTEDEMIEKFLLLLDERNAILSKLKKNEYDHFSVKKSLNKSHSNLSSSSHFSIGDGTFNLSALQGGRLPLKTKKNSNFNTKDK